MASQRSILKKHDAANTNSRPSFIPRKVLNFSRGIHNEYYIYRPIRTARRTSRDSSPGAWTEPSGQGWLDTSRASMSFESAYPRRPRRATDPNDDDYVEDARITNQTTANTYANSDHYNFHVTRADLKCTICEVGCETSEGFDAHNATRNRMQQTDNNNNNGFNTASFIAPSGTAEFGGSDPDNYNFSVYVDPTDRHYCLYCSNSYLSFEDMMSHVGAAHCD